MATTTEPPEVNTKAAEEEEDDKVLDLTTLSPNRRLVKLPTKKSPGEVFELRLLDDFGIARQQQLLAWTRKFEALFNKEEDLTEAEADRMKFCLDSVFEEVLDAPKTVKKDMPDSVRSRVVTGFSLAPQIARLEQAAQQEKEDVLAILMKKELVTQEQVDEAFAQAREAKSDSNPTSVS